MSYNIVRRALADQPEALAIFNDLAREHAQLGNEVVSLKNQLAEAQRGKSGLDEEALRLGLDAMRRALPDLESAHARIGRAIAAAVGAPADNSNAPPASDHVNDMIVEPPNPQS